MRLLPLFLLAAACTDESSSSGLSVDAHLQAMSCDGRPCTHVELDVRRDSLVVGDASVWLSLDGEPSFEVPFDGEWYYVIEVPQWVRDARIDVTAGEDVMTIEGDNPLSSPFEMAAAVPETVTVGSTPHLTWRAQGDPVRATVLFATKVPATRFGFLEVEGDDDGDFEIESIFTAVGEYTIALYRTAEHDGILWGSNWQQRVNAIIDPK